MSKLYNSQYDNIEDKKEIFNIIHNYLNERQREALLNWCCRQVNTDIANVLRPGRASTWDSKEVYWQIMSLAFMHHLNLDIVTQELTRIARLK